jgi:hypothetical protein
MIFKSVNFELHDFENSLSTICDFGRKQISASVSYCLPRLPLNLSSAELAYLKAIGN